MSDIFLLFQRFFYFPYLQEDFQAKANFHHSLRTHCTIGYSFCSLLQSNLCASIFSHIHLLLYFLKQLQQQILLYKSFNERFLYDVNLKSIPLILPFTRQEESKSRAFELTPLRLACQRVFYAMLQKEFSCFWNLCSSTWLISDAFDTSLWPYIRWVSDSYWTDSSCISFDRILIKSNRSYHGYGFGFE